MEIEVVVASTSEAIQANQTFFAGYIMQPCFSWRGFETRNHFDGDGT
jgi:hypothetical protein